MTLDKEDRLRTTILELCRQTGVELFELNIHFRGREMLLKILVDRPQGGITIQQCADLNRSIAQALETGDMCPEGFELELSSPGADRPLKEPRDYRRIGGRAVRLELSQPLNGQKELTGELRGVDNDQVTVLINGEEVPVVLKNIIRASEVL